MKDDYVAQGIEAFKAGEVAKSRQLLIKAIEEDSKNELAWLAMSVIVQKPEHAIACLQRVLEINPTNEKARRRLRELQATTPEPQVIPVPGIQAPIGEVDSPGTLPSEDFEESATLPLRIPRRMKSRMANYLFIGSSVILFLVIVYALLYALIFSRPEGSPVQEAIDPSKDPRQTLISEGEADTILLDGWNYQATLNPRANYKVAARILGTRRYQFDIQSAFIPYDFALGWGKMSDRAVDDFIVWSQADRWYYYNLVGNTPYTMDYVKDHSANTHIIPATENLAAAIKEVKKNDLVLLEGLLVDVNASLFVIDFVSETSLKRKDTGSGSCEILYLERMVVNGEEFK